MKNIRISYQDAKRLCRVASKQFGCTVTLPTVQNEAILITHGCKLWWGDESWMVGGYSADGSDVDQCLAMPDPTKVVW